MITRHDWTGFSCLLLAAALFSFWPSRRETPLPSPPEPVDPAVFRRVNIKFIGFTPEEEAEMLAELRKEFSSPCTEAFEAAGLQSPLRVALETGIVIQHFRLLFMYEADALNLRYKKTRDLYRSEFSSGRVQAGTIPGTRLGLRLTVDGKPHIVIHDSAFLGESFLFGRLGLGDVITHEMVHTGGQGPTPGWLGFLQHDLAGFEHYDAIMGACH